MVTHIVIFIHTTHPYQVTNLEFSLTQTHFVLFYNTIGHFRIFCCSKSCRLGIFDNVEMYPDH